MRCMKLQRNERKLNQELLKGEFGIEKESLRVDACGNLAVTPHIPMPTEQISRDFSESQVEFVSRVHLKLQKACEEICVLQSMVEEKIAHRREGREFIWTYSNPPLYSGEENIKIAEFTGVLESKTAYRNYLSGKYGKVKMLYSGVHFNYSLPDDFFDMYKEYFPGNTKKEKKSEWYVQLTDALMTDSWLIVALTAASPVAEAQFLKDLGIPEGEWEEYASFRNSIYGYWNLFIPELSYASFASYLKSINEYILSKKMDSIQELYYPIRLKPKGENTLANLRETGVNHIELRMLDLNPLCCSGVAGRDLIFIHLLIVYRSARLFRMQENQKIRGTQNSRDKSRIHGIFPETVSDYERILLHQKAARFSFWEENADCKAYAFALLADMKQYFKGYLKNDGYVPADYDIFGVLDFELQKIREPKLRYANQLREKYQPDYIGMRMKEVKGGVR